MSRRRKKRPISLRRGLVPNATHPAPKQSTLAKRSKEAAQDICDATHANTRAAEHTSLVHDVDATPGFMPYDENLLDVCRTRWQLADWGRLAEIDLNDLLHHPHRARIALLVAAAHWQLGQTQQAQRLMQRAIDWGASQRQIAQILISGIHHSLARAHMIAGEQDDARMHDLDSLRLGGMPGDAELLAAARLQRMTDER